MDMEIDEPVAQVKDILTLNKLIEAFEEYQVAKVDKGILLIGKSLPVEVLVCALSKITSIEIDENGMGCIKINGCSGLYSIEGWQEHE